MRTVEGQARGPRVRPAEVSTIAARYRAGQSFACGVGVGTRGKIVLLHFVGQMPLGGIAWQAANYLVPLQKLGFETWYIEDHGTNPYDPESDSIVMDCAYNVAYLRAVMERCGLGERWAYWDAINDVWHGLPRERAHALYAEADALINLCGSARLGPEHMRCPVRIMIDTDPVYEQIKYARSDPGSRAYIDAHTHFFSYGANLGTPACAVPLCGVPWRATRPPVDLELWPCASGAGRCFTTIATWENKGKNIDFAGESYYWSKHVNFVRFLDIAARRRHTCFEVAMPPQPASVRRQVAGAGWRLLDARPISASMASYQQFIAASHGEFTVAKDIYVRPNSGWFSDRSVCYLATGRPVVTMRTGFTDYCPVGQGLFDYATHEEALAALDAIAADYLGHSRAARELAGDCFAAERVVEQLMTEAGF
jgi:hypothetical protein